LGLLSTLLSAAKDNSMTSSAINSSLNRTALHDVLPTDQAAAAINRKPQTLRKWACLENGPIRPIRINGRLAWRVADLQTLLTVGTV
jgi:hypothetical protein